MGRHNDEVMAGQRFEFGTNWTKFLAILNEDRIKRAEESLQNMLGVAHLQGKTFLDVGSGSGLFSLAAKRLGAKVHSFDYDPQSVACTNELKRRYFPDDTNWQVEAGSVLDSDYLARLGAFDCVYSWGVLHHTGAMWQALDNVAPLVKKEGQLFIAIYNNQGRSSAMWLRTKRIYNVLPKWLRWFVVFVAIVRLWGPTTLRDIVKVKPFHTWREYGNVGTRGMSPWRDVVDWVGGYPFEVAQPEEIFDLYREKGFVLDKLKTCAGGLGCNEFVFRQLP